MKKQGKGEKKPFLSPTFPLFSFFHSFIFFIFTLKHLVVWANNRIFVFNFISKPPK